MPRHEAFILGALALVATGLAAADGNAVCVVVGLVILALVVYLAVTE